MRATIDQEGRIALDHEMQAQLGVQPGDEVLLQARGNELVMKPANDTTGLCDDGDLLVHRGPALPVAAEHAELLEDTGAIHLPPRDLRMLTAKVVAGPRRRLSETAED